MGILQLLASRNYITVNKELIKIVGLEEAIILGELASEYNYYFDKEELDDDYFYSTISNIEENTGLSEHKQRKAINTLKNQDILDVKIKGIPAKRYIKINEEQLLNILNNKFLKNQRTSSLKIKELETKKLKGNKNIINKNKNNNIYNKYGTYQRIKLTDKEYQKLVEDFGEDFIKNQIELLDEYIESNNNKNKYTNFNLVLRKSIRDNWFINNKAKEIKKADVPDWFGKDIDKIELSVKEQEEIDKILEGV